MKQDQWLCQQTITDYIIYSLSLNEQQNKLISCSDDKQILVIEQQKLDKKWTAKQIIQVDYYGFRLCFINNVNLHSNLQAKNKYIYMNWMRVIILLYSAVQVVMVVYSHNNIQSQNASWQIRMIGRKQ
ncbi:unnamed protein product [Paramecium sonneborni]|uniref:Transmembrane protein n=1 Tax=Paramecium sonneborni TaxID=65129 RepID=A0A8S1RRN3_9CILI|nr:unnamed protein product [Paramecium sonneborni]